MKSIIAIVLLALLMIGAGVAKKFDILGYDESKQAAGIIFGLIMVLAANIIPKTLPSVSQRRGRAALRGIIDRDAGWILVLGGLTTILIWLTTPAALAQPVAASVGLLAFVLAGVNAALLWRRERNTQTKEEG